MMKLSIAIPDSSLKDEKKHENKTRKIFQIARAAGVFQINNIIIYKDGREFENDSKLLSMILRYLETPQHFRKRLFPKSGLLQFVGALSPIKMPNQTGTSNAKQVKKNDIREGVIFPRDGEKFIDVGIDVSIPYHGKKEIGKRIIVKIKEEYPNFSVSDIEKEQIPNFWSYNTKHGGNLFSLLKEWKGPKILTSRKSKKIKEEDMKKILSSKEEILVVFGTTDKGIHEMLDKKINNIQNFKAWNFFPNQGTETVRLEEAIFGCLSIINACVFNK
ncbi:MAG: putative RNA uridine N3 methyltransferase [Thermoproteota archaeon]|nr:putative RNA uridine N3 methyltransferase [Thermoproteota archaeon]